MKARSWISSIQTFTYFENGAYSCPKVTFENGAVPFRWEDAEQSTMITDKNGREMFIGDIVISSHGSMASSIYIVARDGVNPSMMLLSATATKSNEYDFVEVGLRRNNVIGNIHENPELLKGK